MKSKDFYAEIKSFNNSATPPLSVHFLLLCDQIINGNQDDLINMTQLTIVFEAYYRSCSVDKNLKQGLLMLRKKRWVNHFGMPTVFFLISYENLIEQLCTEFKKIETDYLILKSLMMRADIKKTADLENHILVDIHAINDVAMPDEEKKGAFVKTHHPSGGFAAAPSDPYSIQFIEYAAHVAKKGGKILEIGAAFGAATLQAIVRGATVFCNDIEPKNLAVVHNRYLQQMKEVQLSATGDYGKLFLVPGAFPDELTELPKQSFDGILICRVLHFFSGEKIEQSLQLANKLLKPGGRLFVICETPYLKNWKRFIPEYEKRMTLGAEWPGEISNPSEFENSGRAASLPSFVHWMSKDVLDRTLIRSHFNIMQSSYINRREQFPDDLLLDGKESVGAVCVTYQDEKNDE
jgi:SAM-dependent methyltransferase